MDPADNKNQDQIDAEALEKSWTSAIDDLKKSLGDPAPEPKGKEKGKTKEELAKAAEAAGKKGEGAEEESSEESEESSSSSSAPPAPAKKSLPDRVAEKDPEAEITMDIEPYLKSLATSIDEAIAEATKPLAKVEKLEKSLKSLGEFVKVLGKAVLANAEMQKSVKDDIAKIGKIDIPSMSRLRKGGDRFQVTEGQEMTRLEIMQKATELCRVGQMSTTDVTILEGRLNAGGDIPEALKPLFKKSA